MQGMFPGNTAPYWAILTYSVCFPLVHHFMYMDPTLTHHIRIQTKEVERLHYQ